MLKMFLSLFHYNNIKNRIINSTLLHMIFWMPCAYFDKNYLQMSKRIFNLPKLRLAKWRNIRFFKIMYSVRRSYKV